MTQLPTTFQHFIYISRYARWLEAENRRETWDETVARYFNFFEKNLKEKNNYTLTPELRSELETAVLNLEVLPSMRCLMSAGAALERCNVAGYNCSYLPIDHPRSFDETLYVLMNGTGVGFSVEKENINKLPVVNEHFEKSPTVIVVEDSKSGWARGLRELIAMLYAGQIPTWDLSKLRPAGARLRTFGGRSSGPEPLNDLFNFCVAKFTGAKGRKLTALECHDIVCKIGDVVVVGGVRRSALISLSDLSDTQAADAKSTFKVHEYSLINETATEWHYAITMKKNQPVSPTYRIVLDKVKNAYDKQELEANNKVGWWVLEPQRALANNSAVYESKPDLLTFMSEWEALVRSQSGERGIFSREAAKKISAKHGKRDVNHRFGTNPCSEIILRPHQFCNLSEVVVRAEDTPETLSRKVRLAAILGTFQSTLTDFKYLRKVWAKNTEEERLLGVSLTGILDNAFMAGKHGDIEDLAKTLDDLRQRAVDTNADFAAALGIPASAAVTCVKPSGTVSQLVDAASGIHPRHSQYYIRTVRGDKKDPLTQFMIAKGVPHEDCVMKPDNTTVFSFPMAAPEGAVLREDMTAVTHLELWKLYQDHWCEHKPSVTISVKEEEWLEVGAWVYKNFDSVSGVSFLPYSEHAYKQAPYQECNEATVVSYRGKMPELHWEELSQFEKEDTTTGNQELACSGGVCEIVDIGK